jgi:hypothetical protein
VNTSFRLTHEPPQFGTPIPPIDFISLTPCNWPDCLDADTQQRLAEEVGRVMKGEPATPGFNAQCPLANRRGCHD